MSFNRGKDGAKEEGCFYGWVIVFACILCKIFKVQGENKVMTYTVPHLLEDFELSHAHLGGFFSAATIMAGLCQPLLGWAVDYFGGRVCISLLQVAISASLAVFATWQCPESRMMLRVEAVFMFFFLRLMCLGAGEIFPSACVQQWFHQKRGRAIGVIFTAQWLGQALFGSFIAFVVERYNWHQAALVGAVLNLSLAPLSFLLLRRSPEVCGLRPDGIIETEDVEMEEANAMREPLTELKDVEASKVKEVQEMPEMRTDIRQFWAHFGLTFFYAMMFGGSDFYMVEIVAESSAEVSVPWLIFTPMAVVTSISLPAVGELMDAYSSLTWLPAALLALAGILASISTLILSSIGSWFGAVCYGVLRGICTGILQSLLLAGLSFSAQGVSRAEIGRILGYNTFCNLLGTGSSPFLLGTCRDLSGGFTVALRLISIPPLLLGAFFASQARLKKPA